MAQTKAASSGQRTRGSQKSQARPKKTRPKKASSNSKPRSSGKTNEASSSRPKVAGEAVEETAKQAGRAVGRAASKAKVPLVAGGAALAGAAGGIALGTHQARRHRGIGGVKADDVVKAAKKAGDFGARMGELAFEVRRAREVSNGRAHRSPVEVVLQGLTARHPRS